MSSRLLVRTVATLERRSTVAKSIQRNHRQPTHRTPRYKGWVPAAYRGSGKSPPRRTRGREEIKTRRVVGERSSDRQSSKLPQGPPSKEEKHDRTRWKENASRLVVLQNKLAQLAKDYRNVFSPEAAGAIEIEVEDFSNLNKRETQTNTLRSMTKRLKSALDGIHEADNPIDWGQITKTEVMFQEIARLLQDTIFVSTNLCRLDRNNQIRESADLAEQAFRGLVAFGSERALIVKSSRKWTAKQRNESGRSWISSLFEGFQESGQPTDGPMAHDDPSLGVSQHHFFAVTESIANIPYRGKVPDESTVEFQADREEIAAAARRLTELMNLMPSTWQPSASIGRRFLEVLSRVGTPESARTCHEIFQRPGFPENLRFSLVLHAYLEAIKHEHDPEMLEVLARESLEVLKKQWEIVFPAKRIEQIIQYSLLLQCFLEANVGRIPEMREEAIRLMKRIRGSDQLLEAIFSDEESKDPVDSQVLPILSYIVQLLASSGDQASLGQAKVILRYVTQVNREGLGMSIVHPNVHTFNAVIKGIVEHYESEGYTDDGVVEQDMEYTDNLLEYMVGRNETGCWPNDETFQPLLRFLPVARPKDIGDRAERLLLQMEIFKQRSSAVNITLSDYHRVLGCWFVAVKAGTSKNACQRAMRLLEKLEIQSMPLIMSDRNVSAVSIRNLYDVSLRPNAKTYKLVLSICDKTEDPEHKEEAAGIAFDVVRRMAQRDMLSNDKQAIKLFRDCLSSLPEESDLTHEVKTFSKELISAET